MEFCIDYDTPSQLIAYSPTFGILCLPSTEFILDDGNFLHILSDNNHEAEFQQQRIPLSFEEVKNSIPTNSLLIFNCKIQF